MGAPSLSLWARAWHRVLGSCVRGRRSLPRRRALASYRRIAPDSSGFLSAAFFFRVRLLLPSSYLLAASEPPSGQAAASLTRLGARCHTRASAGPRTPSLLAGGTTCGRPPDYHFRFRRLDRGGSGHSDTMVGVGLSSAATLKPPPSRSALTGKRKGIAEASGREARAAEARMRRKGREPGATTGGRARKRQRKGKASGAKRR